MDIRHPRVPFELSIIAMMIDGKWYVHFGLGVLGLLTKGEEIEVI